MTYILVFLFSVFVASLSQVLLKISAGRTYDSPLKEYLNPFVIIAYGLFSSTTLIELYAYKGLPLSMGPILEATGYMWVAVLSFLILKEKISKKKLLGLAVIIIGIIIYSL